MRLLSPWGGYIQTHQCVQSAFPFKSFSMRSGSLGMQPLGVPGISAIWTSLSQFLVQTRSLRPDVTRERQIRPIHPIVPQRNPQYFARVNDLPLPFTVGFLCGQISHSPCQQRAAHVSKRGIMWNRLPFPWDRLQFPWILDNLFTPSLSTEDVSDKPNKSWDWSNSDDKNSESVDGIDRKQENRSLDKETKRNQIFKNHSIE
jgi:hypothetical protein